MLDLVDNWFQAEAGGLALDVYRQMRREERTMQRFCGNSPLLGVRRRLIDWMEMAAQTMQTKRGRPLALSSITLHLAVYLFDIYLDRTPHLDSNNIHLIAAVSLRLAAKLEEHEARVPHPDILNLMIQRDLGSSMTAYTPSWYSEYERQLISLFSWRLMLPTPPQFAHYFLSVAADDVVDHFCSPSPNGGYCLPVGIGTPPSNIIRIDTPSRPRTRHEMKTLIERGVQTALAMSLKVLPIRSEAPSLIAAACVALARQHLDMRPRWTQRLAEVSGYLDVDNSPLANAIFHLQNQIVAETLAQMQFGGWQQCAQTPSRQMLYPSPAMSTPFIPNTPVVFAMSEQQLFTQQQHQFISHQQIVSEPLRVYPCEWTGGYPTAVGGERSRLVALPSVNGLRIISVPSPLVEPMIPPRPNMMPQLLPNCRVEAARPVKSRRPRDVPAPKPADEPRLTAGGQDAEPVVVVVEELAAVRAAMVVSCCAISSTTAQVAQVAPMRPVTRSMTNKNAIKRPWPELIVERKKRVKKAPAVVQ